MKALDRKGIVVVLYSVKDACTRALQLLVERKSDADG